MLAAERAGDICYTSLYGCIKARAVLGLCTWDRLVVSVCMQLDAQQILQRSVQLSPCHVGTVPSAVVLLNIDVVGKADLCRVPFLRRHRAAASEAYFVGGFKPSRREQS